MIINKISKMLSATTVAVIVMAGGAFAQEVQTWDCGETPGTVTCTLSDGIFTVSGTGAMYNNSFPSWSGSRNSIANVVIVDGVTSIGESAFSGCTGLTSVTIPNSVKSIGNYAFSGCTGLTSVTIPNSVTSIGESAFYGCSGLTSVVIPNSVTSIGQYAFYGCSGLTSVTISNSVTSIDWAAFSGCTGLTSVTIPASVTSIGKRAFYGCTGLTSIDVGNDNTTYSSVDGVLFNKDKTTLVMYPMGKQGTYSIPNSVTSIGEMAFYYCTGLTSVTIGGGVTSIGDFAFCGCTGLTSVTIGDGVTSIGEMAFYGCTDLMSVTIPNSVTSIGYGAFWDCTGLTSVTIPNSVTSIENCTFSGCTGLTSVTIGNSVTSVGDSTFYGIEDVKSIISLSAIPPEAGNLNGRPGSWDLSTCLYVPETSIEAYRSAVGWSNFSCIQGVTVSVLTSDRIVPTVKPNEEATVIVPTVILAGELTVGPNPVSRQSGSVNFFRQGKRVANCELRIYDATGNVINKVKISDNKTIDSQARRQVGTWDLCDRNGRIVSEGTYVVKGVVKTSDGKSEKVSVILSVR